MEGGELVPASSGVWSDRTVGGGAKRVIDRTDLLRLRALSRREQLDDVLDHSHFLRRAVFQQAVDFLEPFPHFLRLFLRKAELLIQLDPER